MGMGIHGNIHRANKSTKNIPFSHWSPEYPARHSQVSGAVQFPPFSQGGSHTAKIYMGIFMEQICIYSILVPYLH